MRPVIAVPYLPGSNGDVDAINRIEEFGMEAKPLYFHIGDQERLRANAETLARHVDGAVLPGGFPYEDRIGFGVVPAKIQPFANALRTLVDSGKPVIAFCSGNQIAHAMNLAFPQGSPYQVQMLPNICDLDGDLVYEGFRDDEVFTRLACPPARTAFTRFYNEGEVMPAVMDHGGGRFSADDATLQYMLENGMIVKQYCDAQGNIRDTFPVNPNGSVLNIESITNPRGNLKVGMCHDERKTNALKTDRANLVFESMRDYILHGCPPIDVHARPQAMPIIRRDFSYLSRPIDPQRAIDIYVKMLTDDNERTTAQLFLGEDASIDRRRLIRVEVAPDVSPEAVMKDVVTEIAKIDILKGIMLKKDLPSVTTQGQPVFTYEVVEKRGGQNIRGFTEHAELVEGYPVMHEEVSLPNPAGYALKRTLSRNEKLRQIVTNVHTGRVWFFPDEKSKERAIAELLG